MNRRELRLYLPLWLLLNLAGSCSLTHSGQMAGRTQPDAGSVSPSGSSPRLILLLVIDQARSDYLDRFRPLFSGGLGRLLDNGIFFSQAYHGHARTHTASGHATLVTGRHPAHHGIIANQWFDRDKKEEVYCVGDPVHGR
ncbi:MAG: alkaline phosphatase family protein, partial [Acidobacteria bacterium]|nr:alkaline phosphatase family protein [Acidobacteriota bacterium]